jgi:hypothetical protein
MPSGELARLNGVSTDTLRHYEGFGLLPREFAQVAYFLLSPRKLEGKTGCECFAPNCLFFGRS